MSALSLPPLRRGGRWLRSRVGNGALILLYHRLDEEESDPFSLCVRPDHFAEHLDVLGNDATPMSLRDFLEAVRVRDIPSRAVVVTFDDGYADTLHCAKPLLERHRIPATVFVTTGNPGRPFWWDDLSGILLCSRSLPAEIDLKLDGRPVRLRSRQWSRSEREHSLRLLHGKLLPLSADQRERFLEQLAKKVGEVAPNSPSGRALTPDELVELSSSRLVEVGGHTVTHPQLAALPASRQRLEIRKCKQDLEALLGFAPTSFAYPFGRAGDYTATTAAILAEEGFDCSCTSLTDVARKPNQIFSLPRLWVHDWDGSTFRQRMGRWLRGSPPR